jgi:1-deoxy-D-xylulose-5-phosphate reductoisomerase
MSAIVGAAAMRPTLAAIERGATVALANKESLVCAGALMKAAAARSGARLLPVDSEHNAVFQVLGDPARVERITLTASGGPFRTWTRQAMAAAGPAEACKHPNFSMGAKISVDSATLMNKGLELIEAACLFDMPSERLDVVVHPQQAVHALVSYCDGSVLAHLGQPDMRVPIAHALAWPDRIPVAVARLDLVALGQLTFEAPDLERFPALRLARRALTEGGASPAVLNAANETAVAAFLEGRIGFLDIARIVEGVTDSHRAGRLGEIANSPSSFDEVMAADAAARRAAAQETARLNAA